MELNCLVSFRLMARVTDKVQFPQTIMNDTSIYSLEASREKVAIHAFLQRVYLWMTIGIGLTAFVGLWASETHQVATYLTSSFTPMLVLMLATLGMVIVLSAAIHKLSAPTAMVLFLVYSVLEGLFLTPVFLIYTQASLFTTFICTASMFGAMTVYAFTTKRDLSGWGRFLFMALIGLIISMVVNIFFMKNGMMDLVLSGIGVVVFAGLTAYDTQKLIKNPDFLGIGFAKASILGALELYLDFINLFLYLLRFLGRRN